MGGGDGGGGGEEGSCGGRPLQPAQPTARGLRGEEEAGRRTCRCVRSVWSRVLRQQGREALNILNI